MKTVEPAPMNCGLRMSAIETWMRCTHWRRSAWTVGAAGDSDQALRRQWVQRIHVSIADMRSPQFIGAGSTVFINRARGHPVAGTSGSLVSDSGALEKGDGYDAVVYYPRPTE